MIEALHGIHAFIWVILTEHLFLFQSTYLWDRLIITSALNRTDGNSRVKTWY